MHEKDHPTTVDGRHYITTVDGRPGCRLITVDGRCSCRSPTGSRKTLFPPSTFSTVTGTIPYPRGLGSRGGGYALPWAMLPTMLPCQWGPRARAALNLWGPRGSTAACGRLAVLRAATCRGHGVALLPLPGGAPLPLEISRKHSRVCAGREKDEVQIGE
jgi:hypothetical protein